MLSELTTLHGSIIDLQVETSGDGSGGDSEIEMGFEISVRELFLPETKIQITKKGRTIVMISDQVLEEVLEEIAKSHLGKVTVKRRDTLIVSMTIPGALLTEKSVMKALAPYILRYPSLFIYK